MNSRIWDIKKRRNYSWEWLWTGLGKWLWEININVGFVPAEIVTWAVPQHRRANVKLPIRLDAAIVTWACRLLPNRPDSMVRKKIALKVEFQQMLHFTPIAVWWPKIIILLINR